MDSREIVMTTVPIDASAAEKMEVVQTAIYSGSQAWINIAYVIAAVLFIMGLKGLSHPRSAVRGNLFGAMGMLLAILATLCYHEIIGFTLIIVGLAIGAVIGIVGVLLLARTLTSNDLKTPNHETPNHAPSKPNNPNEPKP